MRIEPSTTITIHTFESLLAAWKSLGGQRSLVSRIVFTGKPLTASQLRRLPKALREKIEYPDDALDFLERMYCLEDPRG
jgi:hypothetical protein